MEQGMELEQYLITCQSIPATFIIPLYPLLLSNLDYFMPVLQERSKQQDKKIYCQLVIILIAKAHEKGNGARTMFDYMP